MLTTLDCPARSIRDTDPTKQLYLGLLLAQEALWTLLEEDDDSQDEHPAHDLLDCHVDVRDAWRALAYMVAAEREAIEGNIESTPWLRAFDKARTNARARGDIPDCAAFVAEWLAK